MRYKVEISGKKGEPWFYHICEAVSKDSAKRKAIAQAIAWGWKTPKIQSVKEAA